MEIKTVGIVGCGLMGSGIAETCARNDYTTIVREINDELVEKGRDRIKSSMDRGLNRGKMTEVEYDEAWDNLSFTTELADFHNCDLIVEAVVENMELKKDVFSQIDEIVPANTLIASNTSSLSITEMASVTGRRPQVLGMHFFNPVPVMPLIELVRGLETSDETIETARAFGETLGKEIVVAKDNPGFIVNLLLIPYLLDAIRWYEAGLATKEDIDKGIKLGLNHPMGPLTLLDFVGLDTTLFIADAMYDEFKDPRYAAPPLLRRMVTAGHHGRKSGQGFYDYE